MEITQKIKLNVKKTVEHSVAGNDEFHFFADELNEDNSMPTYIGLADEKYKFKEMNDDFFEFLKKKSSEAGIYIRLVFATTTFTNGETVFKLEYAGQEEEFITDDLDNVLEFEFADFGIKIKDDEVTFGTSIDNGCGRGVYFTEFGSDKGNSEYLSLNNPLNVHVLEIMEGMIKWLIMC